MMVLGWVDAGGGALAHPASVAVNTAANRVNRMADSRA
jgi:hypothetical protein